VWGVYARVCVNRNRGRYCFLFCKGPILNDIRGHSDPKNIYTRLQEIASNFSKVSGGGLQTPPPALAPLALGSGFRPLTRPPLSKIPGSAPDYITSHHGVCRRQEAIGVRQQATREADDNRALWENEIKSRSKLGLRVSHCIHIYIGNRE